MAECANIALLLTFLLGSELSESVELSVALDDEELEPDEELFEELDVEAEVLPPGLALGGMSEKSNVTPRF